MQGRRVIVFQLTAEETMKELDVLSGGRLPMMCTLAKARKHVLFGGSSYLAFVVDSRETVASVPVVGEFPDVFPDDLSDISHERQVEFRIKLIPGGGVDLYRVAPPKMQELMWMCTDYREITKLTIPAVEDRRSLRSTSGSHVVLEDRSSLRVRGEDVHKAVFYIRYVYFEFMVMSFGLTNAPTAFVDSVYQNIAGQCWIDQGRCKWSTFEVYWRLYARHVECGGKKTAAIEILRKKLCEVLGLVVSNDDLASRYVMQSRRRAVKSESSNKEGGMGQVVRACLPMRCCARGGVGLPSLGEVSQSELGMPTVSRSRLRELRGPAVICESVREEWSDKRVRNPYLFSSSFQRNVREERKGRIGSGSKEFNRRFVVIDCVIDHVSCAKLMVEIGVLGLKSHLQSHPATEDFGYPRVNPRVVTLGMTLRLSAGQAAGGDPRFDPPFVLSQFLSFPFRARLGFFGLWTPRGLCNLMLGEVSGKLVEVCPGREKRKFSNETPRLQQFSLSLKLKDDNWDVTDSRERKKLEREERFENESDEVGLGSAVDEVGEVLYEILLGLSSVKSKN
ncbi:LOW QUALITY PROTEIN: hypothetical protein OSB04_012235 [Centaurea solstitialis]|uniref:Uncharacterized protein n=1 Tax=Centaurea solstitialis TaxID=347529 RepID=A0AA38TLP0_9ASTR|nr:LOW QUALITY PROTEIN: hypothetical protein OSB04_012235 [Centaurea solstitialis]